MLLSGLHADEEIRTGLFAVLEERAGTNLRGLHPGEILVMGVVFMGWICDVDHFHEPVNEHMSLHWFRAGVHFRIVRSLC